MVQSWSINNVVQDNLSNELIIDSLNQNIVVIVNFERSVKLHSIDADGTHYSITDIIKTPNDIGTAREIRDRGTVTFTVTPESGSYFASLKVNKIDCTKEITNGDTDVITVVKNKDDSYTITVAKVSMNIELEAEVLRYQVVTGTLDDMEDPEGMPEEVNTVHKIRLAMEKQVQNALSSSATIETYDVQLQVSTDGGKTWVPATEENFPAAGITFTLPYPTGIDKDNAKDYDFVITHMLTSTINGATPGKIEKPLYTLTESGFQMHVMSLSPFAIGYKLKSSGGGGGGGGSTGGGGGIVPAATHKITVTYTVGGSVSPASVDVQSGNDQSFNFVANVGYTIDDVLIDGVSVGKISRYTFENVTQEHSLHVVFMPNEGVKFVDVPDNSWFHDSVYKAVANGWFAGTSKTKFSPSMPMTRGMFATVIYRIEQEPSITISDIFDDVANDMYYTNGIIWAAKNNIVAGYGNRKFGPNDDIAREQLASMLYRYARFKGYDVNKTASLNTFADANEISEYAQNSMKWAYAQGIISGKGNGILDPKGKATRAEVATILVRFIEIFKEDEE